MPSTLEESPLKGQPTSEQLERLSKITNANQRTALQSAIERNEEIPEYAWTPINPQWDENFLTNLVKRARKSALRNAVLNFLRDGKLDIVLCVLFVVILVYFLLLR